MSHVTKICGLSCVVLCLVLNGCGMNEIAANTAADMAHQSAPHMRGFWDYEIAGTGIAASIMQLEAMHSVSPSNERLSLLLASSYVGYAVGWLEVEMERAEDAGRYDDAARQKHRAELLYQRARDLAVGVMRYRHSGIDAVLMTTEPTRLKRYLQEHYTDSEDDVAPLFWAASAWGSQLNLTDDISNVVALPTIRTLIEHSVRLNPGFEMAGGLQFLGGLYAQSPPEFGGNPEKGRLYFEEALKLTGRRAHLVHLNYARFYALTQSDKPLFLLLLREVVEADDQGREFRLANKIARARAELLLAKANQLL